MKSLGSMLYDTFMSPLEHMRLTEVRKHLISQAYGNILEIGPGTGANLPFYNWKAVQKLTLLDINLSKKVLSFSSPADTTIDFIEGSAENLPFSPDSFDSIVFTLVFCSVPDPVKGFNEIYRVLKPGGRIYFIEHVLSHDQPYESIMNSINRPWSKVAGGCNINRDTVNTIRQTNFEIEEFESFWKNIFIRGVGKKPA